MTARAVWPPLTEHEPVPPVKSGRLPGWLRKWMEEVTSCDRLDVEYVFQNKLAGHGWLDHWGTVEYNGHEYLVSEPYGLTREGAMALMKFCDELDLDFEIHAASRHYPSQTLRIIVGAKNWE